VFVGGGGWLPGRAPGGSIGWFPLGPHEPYVPPYRSDRSRLHNVDVEHFTYANRTVPGAVTVVANDDFMRGHATGASAFVLRQDELVRAPVLGAEPLLVPHQGFSPGPAVSRSPVAQPPAWVSARTVVARRAPPAPAVQGGFQQYIPVRPGTVQPAPVARPPVRVLSPGYPRPATRTSPSYQVPPRNSPSPQYVTPRQGQRAPAIVQPRPRYPSAAPGGPPGTVNRQLPAQRDAPAPRGTDRGRSDSSKDDPLWLLKDR
jgi:hypothetical protein